MSLTVWEQLQLLASRQVEVFQVGQLPDTFGHHRNNSQSDVTKISILQDTMNST